MAGNSGLSLRRRMALWSPPQFSVNGLKLAGTVLMALYFFSASVVQNGILHVSEYTAEQLSELMAGDGQYMMWAGIGSVTLAVGIMGLPIFAYLLVQGVEHTASLQRYILTVFAFAVVSEVPYDLAMSGQVWNLSDQNSLWTVLIALIMLWLMKTFQGKGMAPVVLSILFTAAGCFWAILLRSRFGGGFVLITAILYLLREKKGLSYALGAAVSLLYTTALLGFVPVAMCSGKRRDMGRGKYGYYLFYPVMLVLFSLWSVLAHH